MMAATRPTLVPARRWPDLKAAPIYSTPGTSFAGSKTSSRLVIGSRGANNGAVPTS
jgi:hypothetical protein